MYEKPPHKSATYSFSLQILLQKSLALMQPAESIDLILIFAAHFEIILTY